MPLSDNERLGRFLASQGVPEVDHGGQIEQLPRKVREAILASIDESGAPSVAAADTWAAHLDVRLLVAQTAEARQRLESTIPGSVLADDAEPPTTPAE